jgi:hypothetical protein
MTIHAPCPYAEWLSLLIEGPSNLRTANARRHAIEIARGHVGHQSIGVALYV